MVEITLYNGDCLQVMKELPARSVDLIICDLPYGCLSAKGNPNIYDKNVKSGKRVTGGVHDACAWDIKINLEEFWKEVKRVRKNEHSPCIHFCTTKFGYELIQSNPKEFRYDIVWNKQRGVSFLTANKMPMRSHEMIYVFSKAGAFYHRIDEEACALSVINSKRGRIIKQNHPTEKSEDLYQWLIERYCPVGGTVLDPTFGSGNSVFTAYGMGRNAIGIEMNEEFFNKAVERLNN